MPGLVAVVVLAIAGAAVWPRLPVPEHGGTAQRADPDMPVTAYGDVGAVPHVIADCPGDACHTPATCTPGTSSDHRENAQEGRREPLER